MLEIYQRYAYRLRWARLPALYLAIMSLGVVLYQLIWVPPGGERSVLIAAILIFLYALSGYAFISGLQQLPQAPTQKGWRAKLAYRLQRFYYNGLALAFSVLSIVLLVLSIRFLKAA